MATIKDIARETGLGLATISKYLNGGHVLERNKEAIESAIDRLGYTVNEFARGLKTSRSKSIGVVIPELSNVFITTIITVVEDILRSSGYSVLICDCRTDEKQEAAAVQFLLGKRVDGIINMPVSRDGSHLLPAIKKGVPVVLIDRMINGFQQSVHAVLVDNVGGASDATVTLIKAGHKQIGLILGPQGVFTSSQRLLGYSQAMIQSALIPDERHIVYSNYTVQGGYESMRRLLDNPEITAVFLTNYEMTLGAIIAINELGIKVPDRLSLIGFDNQQLYRVIQPPLTIVTQPLEEIGEAAADILLRALESPGDERKNDIRILVTGMIHGSSVKQI